MTSGGASQPHSSKTECDEMRKKDKGKRRRQRFFFFFSFFPSRTQNINQLDFVVLGGARTTRLDSRCSEWRWSPTDVKTLVKVQMIVTTAVHSQWQLVVGRQLSWRATGQVAPRCPASGRTERRQEGMEVARETVSSRVL